MFFLFVRFSATVPTHTVPGEFYKVGILVRLTAVPNPLTQGLEVFRNCLLNAWVEEEVFSFWHCWGKRA